jgi:hypothetical protein
VQGGGNWRETGAESCFVRRVKRLLENGLNKKNSFLVPPEENRGATARALGVAGAGRAVERGLCTVVRKLFTRGGVWALRGAWRVKSKRDRTRKKRRQREGIFACRKRIPVDRIPCVSKATGLRHQRSRQLVKCGLAAGVLPKHFSLSGFSRCLPPPPPDLTGCRPAG